MARWTVVCDSCMASFDGYQPYQIEKNVKSCKWCADDLCAHCDQDKALQMHSDCAEQYREEEAENGN